MMRLFGMEFLMGWALCVVMYMIADIEERSPLLWGVITFVLCLLSLLIPIPFARILLAGVVAIAGMMACKMMRK